MNRPPCDQESINIKPEHLRKFSSECLRSSGMNETHAEQLSDLLTKSDLRGVRSHGTRALTGYCRLLHKKGANPNPEITVVNETDTSIFIDGDGGLGYAPTMLATEQVIKKAKKKGIAVGGIRCIGHYGSAGHYVHRAMEEKCTAYSVQGAYPQYYPSNKDKRAAHYGNPPLCFGFPGEEGAPIVLDGATCILADYQRGEEFEELESQIPAAFFKSMGYTAIGTLLGGAFVGLADKRAKSIQKLWPAARLGGLVVVMDLGIFAKPEEVCQGVDEMNRLATEEMTPVAGYDETTLPGTIEHHHTKEYQQNGIPISFEDLKRLEECGNEWGVELPWHV